MDGWCDSHGPLDVVILLTNADLLPVFISVLGLTVLIGDEIHLLITVTGKIRLRAFLIRSVPRTPHRKIILICCLNLHRRTYFRERSHKTNLTSDKSILINVIKCLASAGGHADCLQ